MTEMTAGEVLQLLQNGTVEIEGLLPWSSNYAFLVRVCDGPVEVGAVYKPRRGERPLWDFAQGTLCQRELAAFVVSEALGWHIVPPTVLRDAQHGPGTIQLYIDHDPARHYFTIEGDTSFRTPVSYTHLGADDIGHRQRRLPLSAEYHSPHDRRRRQHRHRR